MWAQYEHIHVATINYEDFDEIDDAILYQVEDGITYSTGSSDPPTQQPPILPDPGASLVSST